MPIVMFDLERFNKTWRPPRLHRRMEESAPIGLHRRPEKSQEGLFVELKEQAIFERCAPLTVPGMAGKTNLTSICPTM